MPDYEIIRKKLCKLVYRSNACPVTRALLIFFYHEILNFLSDIERMNTYQVHIVVRRCMPVRDHAWTMFLLPGNAETTTIRLNCPGYLDGSPSRLLSTAIDLKRADFVWDAAQPVDHRGICSSIIVAAIASSHQICWSRDKTLWLENDWSLDDSEELHFCRTNCRS